MEQLTGEPAEGCPWHAFSDPDVLLVLEAHQHWEQHQAREFWGDDPEWWLVGAVAHYARALEAVRADDLERNRGPSPGAGPPDGHEREVSVRG